MGIEEVQIDSRFANYVSPYRRLEISAQLANLSANLTFYFNSTTHSDHWEYGRLPRTDRELLCRKQNHFCPGHISLRDCTFDVEQLWYGYKSGTVRIRCCLPDYCWSSGRQSDRRLLREI